MGLNFVVDGRLCGRDENRRDLAEQEFGQISAGGFPQPKYVDPVAQIDSGPYVTHCIVTRCRQEVAMANTYAVILRPEPDGGYTVRVPALPEIVTFGADEVEAMAMAKVAIELVLQSRTQVGEPIPPADAPHYREVTVSVA